MLYIKVKWITMLGLWLSGRTLAWHAWGHKFKPWLKKKKKNTKKIYKPPPPYDRLPTTAKLGKDSIFTKKELQKQQITMCKVITVYLRWHPLPFVDLQWCYIASKKTNSEEAKLSQQWTEAWAPAKEHSGRQRPVRPRPVHCAMQCVVWGLLKWLVI